MPRTWKLRCRICRKDLGTIYAPPDGTYELCGVCEEERHNRPKPHNPNGER